MYYIKHNNNKPSHASAPIITFTASCPHTLTPSQQENKSLRLHSDQVRDLERQVKSLQDLQAMVEGGTQTSESLINLSAVTEATDECPASNIPIPPPLPPILSEGGGVPLAPPIPFGE